MTTTTAGPVAADTTTTEVRTAGTAVEPLSARAGRSPQAAGALTAALYVEHGRMVLGLCRLLLRDPFEAEDAAQQAFVNAHKALLRGGRVRRPAQWLAAIARNECRARVLARLREPTLLSHEELAAAAGADPGLDPDGVSTEVRAALRSLPERQREAVVLRDVYGLRHREVGAALGLSLPAVEALLFRARRRLRVRLRPAAGILVLSLALREGLAQALPGFAGAAPVGGGAALGTGVLAKAGGGSLAVKLATGLAAVGTAGSVIAVDTERPGTSSVLRQTAVRPLLGETRAAVPQHLRRAPESRAAERSGADRAEGPGGEGSGHGSGEPGGSGRGPGPAPAPQTESADTSGTSESSASGGSSGTAGTRDSSGPGSAGSSISGPSSTVSSSSVSSSSGSSGPGSPSSGPDDSGEPSGDSGSSDSSGSSGSGSDSSGHGSSDDGH